MGGPMAAMDLWTLVRSPVSFYRRCLMDPPRWPLALLVVATSVGLLSVAAAVALVRTGATVARISGTTVPPGVSVVVFVMAVVAGVCVQMFAFGVWALSVVFLDQLFSKSGRARRLIEFTALAYTTQVSFGAASLLYAFWWFSPEAAGLSGGIGPLTPTAALEQYYANFSAARNWPLPQSGRASDCG